MKHLALTLCLSLLYVGYELARAASIALFARGSAGWSGVFAACGSFVLTFATLELYGRSIEILGEVLTLVVSSSACAAVFIICAAGLSVLREDSVTWWAVVASLYAFREAYVNLIATQIWALLSSDLRAKSTSKLRYWFCVIQGVSCILSAFAGLGAGVMANAGGQMILLYCAAASLAGIALVVIFAHDRRALEGPATRDAQGPSGQKMVETEVRKDNAGLWKVLRSSISLFRRSPLLTALLMEAMVCQILTALINMSFNEAVRHSRMSTTLLRQGARAAGFVGRSSALIGLLSGGLQLLVMPWATIRINPAFLLRMIPLMSGVGFSVAFISPGFRTVTAAYATAKILDYSIRGTALELMYQLMPDNERLLGKEAIATVGVRVGRTVAHVVLYIFSVALGGAPPLRTLMGLAIVASSIWTLALRRVENISGGVGSTEKILSLHGVCNGNGASHHTGRNGRGHAGLASKTAGAHKGPKRL